MSYMKELELILDEILTHMCINQEEYDSMKQEINEVIQGERHFSVLNENGRQALEALEHLSGRMLVNWGEPAPIVNYSEYPDHERS